MIGSVETGIKNGRSEQARRVLRLRCSVRFGRYGRPALVVVGVIQDQAPWSAGSCS